MARESLFHLALASVSLDDVWSFFPWVPPLAHFVHKTCSISVLHGQKLSIPIGPFRDVLFNNAFAGFAHFIFYKEGNANIFNPPGLDIYFNGFRHVFYTFLRYFQLITQSFSNFPPADSSSTINK